MSLISDLDPMIVPRCHRTWENREWAFVALSWEGRGEGGPQHFLKGNLCCTVE